MLHKGLLVIGTILILANFNNGFSIEKEGHNIKNPEEAEELLGLLRDYNTIHTVGSADSEHEKDLLNRIGGYLKFRSDQVFSQKEEFQSRLLDIIWTGLESLRYFGFFPSLAENPVWDLIDRSFELIKDFIRKCEHYIARNSDCPYSYNQKGTMCLAVDILATNLTWEQANLYCKILRGGHLVMFNNANQFHDTISYLKHFDLDEAIPQDGTDPAKPYDYWIGGLKKDNQRWFWLSWQPLPFRPPFAREVLQAERESVAEFEPIPALGSFAALLYPGYYINAVSGTDPFRVPICQVYPGGFGKGLFGSAGYHASTISFDGESENHLQGILGSHLSLEDNIGI